MVELRPATSDDPDLLFGIYRAINQPMFAALGADMCGMLLRQQSSIQESQYSSQYPQLERFVVFQDGAPIGRLYISKCDDDWVLVDIAVLPSQQGKGIGTQLLQDLIISAKTAGRTIRLHVIMDNPAKDWYRRHGFEEVARAEPYVEMKLLP